MQPRTAGHYVWQPLWTDERGMILSAEMIIIVTVVVLGLITGLACLQQAVVAELQDVGGALRGMNQSYGTPSFFGCGKWWGRTSWTSGSRYTDSAYGFVAGGMDAEIGGGRRSVIYDVAPSTPSPVVTPERCETCPPDAVVPQHLPLAPLPDCVECLPGSTTAPLRPRPEIPQGPAPQILPQTW